MAVPGTYCTTSSHFWVMRDCGHLEAAKQPLNIPPRRPGCKPTSRTTMIYIQQCVQTCANTFANAYARMYVHSHTQHICNTHMRTPRVTHYVCSAHTHTAHGETHKQIDSQTDRKGDKQTDTQTHKQTDGHTLCACITHTTHRQLTVHIIPSLHTSKHQTHSIVHHTPHRYQHAQIHTYGRLYVCTYVHTYVHVYALTDTHCNEPSSFRCPETRSCASCETACWPSIDWSRLLRRLGVASKPTPDFRCPANASPRPRMRAHNTHTCTRRQLTQ